MTTKTTFAKALDAFETSVRESEAFEGAETPEQYEAIETQYKRSRAKVMKMFTKLRDRKILDDARRSQ